MFRQGQAAGSNSRISKFALLIVIFLRSTSALTAPATPTANRLVKPSAATPAPSGPVNLQDANAAEKVVTLPTARDDHRTEVVLNSLANQAGWFPEVKIKVSEGIVSINGKAKNAQQIEWLAKTADRLPGVIAVINQTELEQPAVTDLTPAWQELRRLVEAAKKALPAVILALTMMIVFFFVAKIISQGLQKVWGRHISNPFLLSTVAKLTMVPIWAVFFYLTLRTAGLSGLATTIIGGTGAASLIIGFAFKGIAENYLSGLLLAIRSPFTKGDEIQVDKYTGFVQSLNMRGTTIIDYDGNVVLIPNSIVIQSVIRNRTTSPLTRYSFVISISYTDSVGKAQELITNVVKTAPEVLAKPGSSVSVDKLSPSGIDLIIYFWFDASKSNGDRIKLNLVGKIKDLLFANDFHIPDTGREVIFADTLKVHMLQTAAEADETDKKRIEVAKARAAAQLSDHTAPVAVDQAENSDVRALAEDATILKNSEHSDLLK